MSENSNKNLNNTQELETVNVDEDEKIDNGSGGISNDPGSDLPKNNDGNRGNKRKKGIIIAVCAAAVIAGFCVAHSCVADNTNKKDTATEVTKDKDKEIEESVKAAQKAFNAAKQAYDNLPDDASKDDVEKAYETLQAAYGDLAKAQKAAKRNSSNKSDGKKIDDELTANKKIVEEAKKKVDAISGDDLEEKKEETAKAEATPDFSKADNKAEHKPAASNNQSKAEQNKPVQNQNNKSVQPSKNEQAKPAQAKQKSCKVVNHPAVTHQEPVYTTVHHDAVTHQEPVYTQVQTGTKTVVDQAAYDERVSLGDREVCCVCGATFPTEDQVGEHIAAVHNFNGRYTVQEVFQTVHHDAVTHQEPVYENQQTGTKTVVDKAAYDEKVQTGTKTVTDKAAWQETVCH